MSSRTFLTAIQIRMKLAEVHDSAACVLADVTVFLMY